MCLRIYELDVPKFVSDTGLARKVALIKTKKLDFLTDIEMLLMIEKGITGGTYHSSSIYKSLEQMCKIL